MNTVQTIRNVLEKHTIEPQSRELHQVLPGYTQKCAGCSWIGWDHTLHVAKVTERALEGPRMIKRFEELDDVAPGDELNGAIIKCVGIVNPDSGRYDCGEVYEQNDDGTWGILCTPGYNGWEDRAVAAKDLVYPALLLWEPPRQQ